MRTYLRSLLMIIAIIGSNLAYSAEVSRAVFTIGVADHEPVLSVDSVDSSVYTSVSFFTELNDLDGHNVTHQWTFNGRVMFEKYFEVKGSRWRVWTSKTLIPSWTGTWTVNVLDEDRSVLTSRSFEYQ